MAAFATCRRAGWVRFLVVLLCALFVFATLGAPAARAEALTVGLFTAAAVLSAATAALGFKLANSAEGQATLAKMVQDFKVSATAVGLLLVGSKINGLIDGVDYIKMQIKAGKTYLDERVVAWCQQWLGNNGVYSSGSIIQEFPISQNKISLNFEIMEFSSPTIDFDTALASLKLNSSVLKLFNDRPEDFEKLRNLWNTQPTIFSSDVQGAGNFSGYSWISGRYGGATVKDTTASTIQFDIYSNGGTPVFVSWPFFTWSSAGVNYKFNGKVVCVANFLLTKSEYNSTGLSGTDTIGKDVVDKSLDEVLQGLKEWAPDWWDAGADSSTNSSVGAKDLPLNMGSDVKTVTGNPALEVDQPLIYTPWFEQDVGQLRNGETAGTVTNTAISAVDTADKAEAAQGTVEDAQGVVQSLINWGLDYISPDKGLFSRFPLCIPYDAYLLVTAALGVDAQDLGDIVGQSPGELSPQVDDGVAVQSDFVPVISVKHDWTQDGVTTPVEVTIDLRPYDAVIKMIRTLVSVYVIAELIASEYKRIRGS